MHDTKDRDIFHPLQEINTVLKQSLLHVVFKVCVCMYLKSVDHLRLF